MTRPDVYFNVDYAKFEKSIKSGGSDTGNTLQIKQLYFSLLKNSRGFCSCNADLTIKVI